jgi:hypothetical protein
MDINADFYGRARRQGASQYVAGMFADYARTNIRRGVKPVSCKVFLYAIDHGKLETVVGADVLS